MHCVNAQLLQVLDGFIFGESKKFAFVFDARRGMNGEVAMVKFVDNEVGRRS